MKISDIGEIGLIEKIRAKFSGHVDENILGIGDDCAVISQNEFNSLLVSTDLLVENTHFIRNEISAHDLGYKTIAVNLSDIAAMGAKPRYMFLSIAMPADVAISWLDDFFHGMERMLNEYDVLLLGGDTTRSEDKIFINVTVIGEAPPEKIKYRSAAKVGDVICVTGNLGDSAAGLECLLNKICNTEHAKKLLQNHYCPRPHVAEGLFLADYIDVHAMIDISDGINLDLQRIMEMSHCGVEVNLEELPISEELIEFAKFYKVNSYEIAAIGGEDYCLLATIDSKKYAEIAKQFQIKFNRKLTVIGHITEQADKVKYLLDGKHYNLSKKSFTHFK